MIEGLIPEYYEENGNENLHPGVIYGVYDTKDHCWIGEGEGEPHPFVFVDEPDNPIPSGFLRARLCAEISSVQLGFVRTRLRASHLDPNQPWVKKDILDKKLDVDQALTSIESGRIL